MLDRQISEESQAELLRRIATQDREALAKFYDETSGVLFSTAVRILGDAPEAEEVIQDVFLQIWNKAATCDGTLGVPFQWALGITRNRCIDRLRIRKRKSLLMGELTEAATVEAAASTAGQERLSGDEVIAVRSAVKELPPEQRQAIEMAFFGGMTHPEIAEMLKQPLGTIKARIRRGMLKLRDNLRAYV